MVAHWLVGRHSCNPLLGSRPVVAMCSFWLLLLSMRVAFAEVPLSDAETLSNIKQELYTVGNIGALEFWNVSDVGGLCTWPQLRCQLNSTTRIQSLDLQFLGLQGPLPGLLGSLPEIEELYLNDNNFTGEIPPTLFQATRLKVLSLAYNGLSGAIPENVSNLQALISLDLRKNQLSGTLQPLEGLNPNTLQYLYLDGNSLAGDLSPLKSFTKMLTLSAIGNHITGQLDALQGLGALTDLYLSNNQLNGTLSVLAAMRQLQSLDLGYNQLSGDLSSTAFGGDSALRYLWLNSNNLGGNLPSLLWLPSDLRVVNLSSNQFVGSVPPQLCPDQAAIIDFSENSLTGEIPNVLSTTVCGSAFEVWMGGNQLLGSLRSDSMGARSPKRLRILSLSRNNLTGSVPDDLGNYLSSMVIFEVSNNLLQGDLLDSTFISMDKLEVFNVSHNRISGPVPQRLAQLADGHLWSLDLSYNSFTGTLPRFPRTGNYQNSFAGNLGLCSPDQYAQVPPCTIPSPPTPFLSPPQVPENPLPGESRSSSGNKATLAGAVAAVVLAVLVILGCVLVCVRRRMRTRTWEKLELDKHLKAAIWEGVNVVLMPISVLEQATDNFAERNKIGVGGFGTVYKGVLPDGRLVAIKTSNRMPLGTGEVRKQFFNEVRILSQVNYRGLVNLVGCCLTPNLAALVLDYISQGTLSQHLRGDRRVERKLSTWKTRLKIAYQAAEALSYLHTQAHPPIYHRDVKSANILLDDNLDAKVADFGASRPAKLDATHVSTVNIQGTPGYLDPGYFRTFQLTAKSDVYSFGVVLLELLTGRGPLSMLTESSGSTLAEMVASSVGTPDFDLILDCVLEDKLERSTRASMLCVSLLALRCLKEASSQRPSMADVASELLLQLQIMDDTLCSRNDFKPSTRTEDDLPSDPPPGAPTTDFSARRNAQGIPHLFSNHGGSVVGGNGIELSTRLEVILDEYPSDPPLELQPQILRSLGMRK